MILIQLIDEDLLELYENSCFIIIGILNLFNCLILWVDE